MYVCCTYIVRLNYYIGTKYMVKRFIYKYINEKKQKATTQKEMEKSKVFNSFFGRIFFSSFSFAFLSHLYPPLKTVPRPLGPCPIHIAQWILFFAFILMSLLNMSMRTTIDYCEVRVNVIGYRVWGEWKAQCTIQIKEGV